MAARVKPPRAAYKSQKGYWGGPVSQGTVSHRKALPKPSPVKDPIQAFHKVRSAQTIV